VTIWLHNTLTGTKDEFKPQNDNLVKLYTCGPTVYASPHVGNWFGYIVWDILVRLLQTEGYEVNRVMNITDVGHLIGENEGDADTGEDKMTKGARRENKTAWDVAAFYTADFINGINQLGLITPTHLVKATDYIVQQLDLVQTLKSKGFTYQIDDGIYFDTSKFPRYADFAKLDLEGLKAGARIGVNQQKRNISDFALWKFSDPNEKRDMEWATPEGLIDDRLLIEDYREVQSQKTETVATDNPKSIIQNLTGRVATNGAAPDSTDASSGRESGADLLTGPAHLMGFPGWHLECSAMAMSLLGNTLDIHTGGIDHIPVHHTNEIAQSEAATGQQFSRFWLHNNHLKVDGTKVSKSLGNGYTLDDLGAKGYSPMDYRMFALQTHYQSEGNFTFENLSAAQNRLNNWRNIAALRHQTHDTLRNDDEKSTDDTSVSLYTTSQAVIQALQDNLNTPAALAIIDDAFSQLANAKLLDIHQSALVQLLDTIDTNLGLNLSASTPDIDEDTKRIIIQRQQARSNQDWQTSDKLRKEIEKSGVTIKDTTHGPIWEYQF
jgi:cysteinyl-tRNA synthetase